MKRRSKAQRLVDARIQRVVNGFIIPVMIIPNLYRALEMAISDGQSDEELHSLIKIFPGVEVSK